jgi:hypothetical protein
MLLKNRFAVPARQPAAAKNQNPIDRAGATANQLRRAREPL